MCLHLCCSQMALSTLSHFTLFEMKAVTHCSFFLVERELLSLCRVLGDILTVRVGGSLLVIHFISIMSLKQLQTLRGTCSGTAW